MPYVTQAFAIRFVKQMLRKLNFLNAILPWDQLVLQAAKPSRC